MDNKKMDDLVSSRRRGHSYHASKVNSKYLTKQERPPTSSSERPPTSSQHERPMTGTLEDDRPSTSASRCGSRLSTASTNISGLSKRSFQKAQSEKDPSRKSRASTSQSNTRPQFETIQENHELVDSTQKKSVVNRLVVSAPSGGTENDLPRILKTPQGLRKDDMSLAAKEYHWFQRRKVVPQKPNDDSNWIFWRRPQSREKKKKARPLGQVIGHCDLQGIEQTINGSRDMLQRSKTTVTASSQGNVQQFEGLLNIQNVTGNGDLDKSQWSRTLPMTSEMESYLRRVNNLNGRQNYFSNYIGSQTKGGRRGGPIARPKSTQQNLYQKQKSRFGQNSLDDNFKNQGMDAKNLKVQEGRTYELHNKLKDMLKK